MEVVFQNARIKKLCSDPPTRRRRLGDERAKKVVLRLNQMKAADTLAELCSLPQARCHQLSADRDEQFSLDLDGPYRLIVEVRDHPVPRRGDGGIELNEVRSVRVLEITDTH